MPCVRVWGAPFFAGTIFYTLGFTAEDGSHYTVAVNGWQVFQELKPLMTTNATFFQPDSRHKHSDFTHENSTLGEFCFALM